MSEKDQCQMCGIRWEDSRYCPDCEEDLEGITRDIEACPHCHGPSDSPGATCPACEDIFAEHLDEED